MGDGRGTRWLAAVLLLSACGHDGATVESDASAGEPEVQAPVYAFCEGTTRWHYDPLGAEGLPTIPDDIHTVADEASGTGRRVEIAPVHDAWFEGLEPAVASVYESLEGLEGWGVTAPIVMRFTDALGDMPAWQESLEGGAVQLLRMGPEGAVWHPCEVQLVAEDTVAVIWPMGPLEPATEYALLVTSELRDADGECVSPSPTFRAMLEGTHEAAGLDRASERLALYVQAAGLVPEQLAAGVTFTTQRTIELSQDIAANISSRDFAWSDDAVCEVEEEHGLRKCERHFTSWDYRDGIAVMGSEPVTPWELVVSVWMPAEGSGPWPTLLMGHGINSNRGMGHGIARNVADLGIVVVAVDAVGHGDHPTNAGSQSYSGMMQFLGIDAVNLRVDGRALRDNLRQSTADRLQLLELLVQDGDLDGDGTVDVDAEWMGYVGISLGGIMGPEILALSERLDVGVLITAAARMTSIFTYASNMAIMMDVMRELTGSEGATWQLVSAIQGAIDPGDPLTYAPYVVTERLNDAPPPHMLVTMAVGDPTVPNEGTRALAQGLGVEIMHPVMADMGLATLASGPPVHGNLAYTNGVTTGALFQFDRVTDGDGVSPADHDNLPYSDESVHQLRHFLTTWLNPSTTEDGLPEIIDPYPVLGTPELN